MLYLVIQNADYYQGAGTDDWKVLTSDYSEAEDAFAEFKTRGYDSCIVEIDSLTESWAVIDR